MPAWVILALLLLWAYARGRGSAAGSSSFVERLGEAIAQMEGFYPGSRAYRNNNPGNLRDFKNDAGRWIIWPDLEHDSAGFPKFESAADGWEAMYKDLRIKINRGWNLEQLISVWAPPSENDTASYVRFVANRLGIPSDVPLTEYA